LFWYADEAAGPEWTNADAQWKNELAVQFVQVLADAAPADHFAWLDEASREHVAVLYGDAWQETLHTCLSQVWGERWVELDDDVKLRMWTELVADEQQQAEPEPTVAEIEAYLRGEAEVPEAVEQELIAAFTRGTLTVQAV
jgi:hypothetical protein